MTMIIALTIMAAIMIIMRVDGGPLLLMAFH